MQGGEVNTQRDVLSIDKMCQFLEANECMVWTCKNVMVKTSSYMSPNEVGLRQKSTSSQYAMY